MAAPAPHAARLAAVEAGFRSLPERYLGAEPGLRRDLADRARRRRPHLGGALHDARRPRPQGRDEPHARRRHRHRRRHVERAAQRRACRGSRPSGSRLLYARGNLDLAIAFEGMFRLENGRKPLLRIHDVRLPGRRVSTLTMGSGPDVLLIHGLGGAKSSFFDTAAALSRRYRVHALDLPGFGSSSKPTTAPYTARWFAETVRETMDALGIARAHVAGNSMGGRVAIELGLRHPERVAEPGAAVPGRRVRQAHVSPDRARAAARARPAAPPVQPRQGRRALLVAVRRSRRDRPERRRRRRRRVPAHLRERRRADRLPVRRAQHLPRRALRPQRLLRAPVAARGARAVRLGLARPRDPARLRAPRRALAAVGRADRARGLRPRAAGRAPRADDRPAGALLRAHRRARAGAASSAPREAA